MGQISLICSIKAVSHHRFWFSSWDRCTCWPNICALKMSDSSLLWKSMEGEHFLVAGGSFFQKIFGKKKKKRKMLKITEFPEKCKIWQKPSPGTRKCSPPMLFHRRCGSDIFKCTKLKLGQRFPLQNWTDQNIWWCTDEAYLFHSGNLRGPPVYILIGLYWCTPIALSVGPKFLKHQKKAIFYPRGGPK